MAGEGGLRALVALSRVEDLELRILAAGALRHLSLNTRAKRPMVEEGALGSILRRENNIKRNTCTVLSVPVVGAHVLLVVCVLLWHPMSWCVNGGGE